MSIVRAIPRYCAKTVDDFLTDLDSGVRWLDEKIGPFGLLCILVTIGLLVFIAVKTGG